MRRTVKLVGFFSLIAVLGACNANDEESFAFEKVKNEVFKHLHGLGYINGEDKLIVATHEGLYSYDEEWKEANLNKHDYIGFSAVKDGFYSSGHPHSNSEIKNPLGIIKSEDKGASFEKVVFHGESNFHYMAVGYETNTIYVINESPNGVMDYGLYYSEDDGKNWTQPKTKNLNSKYISNLAAHPSISSTFAFGSRDGLFLSKDFGDTFERVGEASRITYATLTKNGGVYANTENNKINLVAFDLQNNNFTNLIIPPVNVDNPIIQITVNSTNEKEITIATLRNDIYQTYDNGVSWEMIANSGTLQDSTPIENTNIAYILQSFRQVLNRF
jgi:photosystem II stability/assembly factor-like uncharacterized protein